MRQIAPRLLAPVLVVSLSFPNPAYALRAPQRERRAQTVGLEESLRSNPIQPAPSAAVPAAATSAVFAGGLEESGGFERLGLRAWFATFGAWKPTKQALGRISDRSLRLSIRGEINRLVKGALKRGEDPKATLQYGIPLVFSVFSPDVLVPYLPFVFRLGGIRELKWSRVSKDELRELAATASQFETRGLAYKIVITPEIGHFERDFDSEGYERALAQYEEAMDLHNDAMLNDRGDPGIPGLPDESDFLHDRLVIDRHQKIALIPEVSASAEGRSGLEELVGEIEQRIAADGDVASYLTEDLVGLLNRVAPDPLSVERFQTLSRLDAAGQKVVPVTPADLQRQGITALSLGDAFRQYRHQAAFDYMDNEQHVAAVLQRLQAIVDLAHPERGPSIRQDLPRRGEERPREIRDSAGIWRPQGAREPLVPTGLTDAEPLLGHLSRLYQDLPAAIKRDLWLSILFHDIAKPINVSDHDRIGAGMVPELLKGAGLPTEDLGLISAVILPHTLFGISYLREANRWEVIRSLAGIAQTLPDMAHRSYFPTMLLLLTAADVDAIGAKGKLTSGRIDFWLKLQSDVQTAIRSGEVPAPTDEQLRVFGTERLNVFIDPLPGHLHSQKDLPGALEQVFQADSSARDLFLARMGRVYRFSYAYEPLRAMADPVGVVQFFRVLLGLVPDQELSYQINFSNKDDSLGFRRVDRDLIDQVRKVVTDPDLKVDPQGRSAKSRYGILRVEKNPDKPELIVQFESGLEENPPAKLTWRAWWATLGSLKPARESLKKFGEARRPELEGATFEMANRLVKGRYFPTYFKGARYALSYGVPAVAEQSGSPEEFIENLRVLEDLTRKMAEKLYRFSGPPYVVERVGDSIQPEGERLERRPGWNLVDPQELNSLVQEAIKVAQGGSGYQIEIVPQREERTYYYWEGHQSDYSSTPMGGGPYGGLYRDESYSVGSPQKIRVVPLEKLNSGLEEAGVPKARQMVRSLRFIVDTGAGEAGVLRLLELAVQLKLQQGLPIAVAGVATEEELAEAEAAMPDDVSRESLRVRVFTYTPGDEESHQIARAFAENSAPELAGLHPELVITEMNRSTVTWFLQALQRLGVNRFTHEMFDRVESYLTAA